MALTKVPSNLDATIATTQSQSDNSTNIATTAYVDLAVSNLSDSAPAALNTLNEIAAALGDDANYASTTTAAIAAKLPLAGGTMTGALIVVDGSTSAPSIGNSGDTNTGIYFPADDQIGLVVGGSRKLFISSTGVAVNNGDLTIGSGGVDVSGTDELRYRMLNNGTFKAGIEVATTNGDMITTSVVDDLSIRAQGNMLFSAGGNSESMRIDSAGRVGIGISPAADFHIGQGPDNRVLITSNGPTLIFKEDNTTDDNFGFYLNSSKFHLQTMDDSFGTVSNKVTVDMDGNVGIGTDSPSAATPLTVYYNSTSQFHVGGAQSGISNNTYFNGSAWVNRNSGAGGSVLQLGTDGTLAFRTATAAASPTLTYKMYMDSAGDLGIGTSSPGARLHVYNNDTNNYSTSIRLGQSYNTVYSQLSSNFGGAMTINAGQGGGTPSLNIQINGAQKANFSGSTTGRLYVSGTSRGRIVTQNLASGDGDDEAGAILLNDYSSWSTIFKESWLGGSSGWGTYWAGSSGALYRREAGDTNPNEYVLIGGGAKRFTFDLNVGGHAYFDGTLTQNSYDYAEYFEWEDGNPSNEERRGFTVVLTDAGLIRKATSDDDPEEIMGAISGTAAVIGDAAMYDWDGKYEIDEWGTRILDDVVTISWTEEDENGESINHSYKETEVPSDVIVPENAGRREHNEYRLTADYDPSHVYVPRDKRPEWGIVGLLGKVRVRDESPKNPRWKYIKTIAGKKLWLIR